MFKGDNMKYNNLEAELKRNKINKKELAEQLNIHYNTFYLKLNGKLELTISEMKYISNLIKETGSNGSLDYLFED